MADKSVVLICSWCQRINDPQLAKFAVGIDTKIKKEMSVVDEKVRKNLSKFTFSHGICVPHIIQLYREQGQTKSQIELMVKNLTAKGQIVPSLIEDAPLRHAYMRGLFTPELMQQAQQHQQKDNEKLTERFKTLAGISS